MANLSLTMTAEQLAYVRIRVGDTVIAKCPAELNCQVTTITDDGNGNKVITVEAWPAQSPITLSRGLQPGLIESGGAIARMAPDLLQPAPIPPQHDIHWAEDGNNADLGN